MSNKFTAVDPAGIVHKRTSQNRVYSHTVVGRRSFNANLKAAQEGHIPTERSNFKFYMAYVNGTSEYLAKKSWENEEQHKRRVDDEVARAVSALAGTTTFEQYRAMLRENAIARVMKAQREGQYDKYVNLGWCGRLDLAQKLASGSLAKNYEDVRILEAVKV